MRGVQRSNEAFERSANLEQQGDTILKNYSGWLQNLDHAIRRQLTI
jgi:hypothetical protein